MNSKSPVVNLAERHETLLQTSDYQCATEGCAIHLLIIHRFISLKYSQNINDCIIFRHFFSVGIGNELLRV